jgi:5-methylcytosine-specific restriction endonuclease McrA
MLAYAKRFYESAGWKDCRESYMRLKLNTCERCGRAADLVHHKIFITPDNINDVWVTLNFENLEALCHDCHNKIHKRIERERRYRFDSNGNLMNSSR